MGVAWIVGAVLLYTGVVKAIDTRQAERVLLQHVPIVACHYARAAVVALVFLETALGATLIMRVALPIAYLAAVGFLLGATWFSVRSLAAGRTADCGCYGGLQVPTALSMGLNLIYLALLAADASARERHLADWHGPNWGPVLVGVAAGGIAWFSHGRPIIDTSSIRIGRRWKRAWGGEALDTNTGQHLIVLMREGCPFCESWVPFVNIFASRHTDVNTRGFVPGAGEDAQRFAAHHGATFGVSAMREGLFDSIAMETPVAASIAGGRIVGVWAGHVPPFLVAEARDYYSDMFASSGIARPETVSIADSDVTAR